MNSRRKFITSSAAFASLAALPSSARSKVISLSNTPQLVALGRPRIITKNPSAYHGWPTVTRRQNGELLLVYSGGREGHICPFGRVELMRSRDDGRTWSDPAVLLDGPIDYRDAGILETAKSTILVTTFTSLAYVPILEKAIRESAWPQDRIDRWLAIHNQLTDTERHRLLGQWIIRSEDGGQTWSEQYPSIVNSPHGPIQLADGRLLHAGKAIWTENGRTGFCVSLDDGNSWEWLADIPVRPGDKIEHYHELHCVETRSGKLITHIRNHNPRNLGETLQSESSDGGATWTAPRSIGVLGHPSHLIRLADDSLFMSYGYRKAPFGNQARVSPDEGKTWSQPFRISNDGTNWDLGYPSSVQLPSGNLLSIWYELKEKNAKAKLYASPFKLLTYPEAAPQNNA